MDLSHLDIRGLLSSLAQGTASVDDVLGQLLEPSPDEAASDPPGHSVDLCLDLERSVRCGFPEVIYSPGKSHDALCRAFQALRDAGQNCLATRCSEEQAAVLRREFPDAIHNACARTVRINHERDLGGKVPVVSAGTSDRPVAEEAVETLTWMNVASELILDIGVAGPHRLLSQKHRLADADAVIVVAGMEGALPSAVGGWVDCPVFAVPTSVGYGAALGGFAALLGMLNSCAANVAVVNIDAGFKAGYLAGMVARRVGKGHDD